MSIRCDLCGYSTYQTLFRKQQSVIVKCLNCGLIFIYPQSDDKKLSSYYQNYVAPSPNDLKHFQKKLNGLNCPSGRAILKRYYNYKKLLSYENFFLKILASFLRNFKFKFIIPYQGEGRILDIGCGTGLYLALLKNIGWDAYGVEVNHSACLYAENLGIKVFEGGLKETKYPSAYFNVVRLNQVLEHLSSPSHTLNEVQRILKSGGTLYIGVPNQRSFAFYFFGEKWLNKGGHLYAFSPTTLRAICQKAGLSTKRIRFKSSKGVLLEGLFLFLERNRFFKISTLFKKKIFYRLLRFLVGFFSPFLNLIHFSDTIIAEVRK